jgi:hypothetical protein
MSLSSILTGTKEKDKEIQSILKSIIPPRKVFNTISGLSPFSAQYKLYVPYSLSSPFNSRVVGTAFDYLARMIIASIVDKNKSTAFSHLAAYSGLINVERNIKSKKVISELEAKYIDSLVAFLKLIYINKLDVKLKKSDLNKIEWVAYKEFLKCPKGLEWNELYLGAYYFAKLELVYRSGGLLPSDIKKSLMDDPDTEILLELEKLCNVFKEKFIIPQILTSDSTVIYNPSFGSSSFELGGADADVFVDGTLYDFKTTKQGGYNWRDVAQLTCYYLISCSENAKEESTSSLYGEDITRIAFYKARFGEIEFYDIKFTNQQKEKALNELKQAFEMQHVYFVE